MCFSFSFIFCWLRISQYSPKPAAPPAAFPAAQANSASCVVCCNSRCVKNRIPPSSYPFRVVVSFFRVLCAPLNESRASQRQHISSRSRLSCGSEMMSSSTTFASQQHSPIATVLRLPRLWILLLVAVVGQTQCGRNNIGGMLSPLVLYYFRHV